jgi:hypothetical protein
MDIKREACDIRTWENHLFLDISSINIDTLAPSLFQCVVTRSIEIFWLLSQPLPHLRLNFFVISETFLQPFVNRFTLQTLPIVNRNHFFMNILCIEFFCPVSKRTKPLLFVSTLLKHGRHFDYWNQSLNMRMRVWCLYCHEAELCC